MHCAASGAGGGDKKGTGTGKGDDEKEFGTGGDEKGAGEGGKREARVKQSEFDIAARLLHQEQWTKFLRGFLRARDCDHVAVEGAIFILADALRTVRSLLSDRSSLSVEFFG